MGKFFTVEVKPEITASIQNATVFADLEVVFPWTAFDVPKGTCKLVDAVVKVYGAASVRQQFQLDYYFAKSRGGSAPASLGTLNATCDGVGYFNDVIGAFTIHTDSFYHGQDFMSVGSIGRSGTAHGEMALPCLTGEPNSGTNVGYDKLYIGALSVTGDPDFRNTINVDGIQATSQAVLTVQGTSAESSFDVGDIIYDEDNRLMGTIKTVDSATQLTMESNLANASVDTKKIFPISPIKIILSFER
jgi:hypothetical protein